MIDNRQQDIKERISRYAMNLWGITDPSKMDPVVDLLLDAFAYNSNRLYQDIEAADAAILHRLARLLVPHKWSLPFPAHALLTICPASGNIRECSIEDQFYVDKMFFGKGTVRLFFTPLAAYPLVDGQVRSIVDGNRMRTCFTDGRRAVSILPNKDEDNELSIWVGVSISEMNLLSTDSLTLCILPENDRLSPLIRDIQVYDTDNHIMRTHTPMFSLPEKEKYYYFEDINDYYADNYVTIDLAGHEHRESLCCTPLPRIWNSDGMDGKLEKLCWFRLQFPNTSQDVDFDEIRILLNTFPVVNRQQAFKKHDFSKEGSIVSLPYSAETHFLHIDSLQDNEGRNYTDIQSHYEGNPSGAFSVYFGNLERFDTDNARSLIIKLMHLLREDGMAFSSENSEILGGKLTELYESITSMGKNSYDLVQRGNRPRVFLLTYPEKGAENVEVKYWLSNGPTGNGLDETTPLSHHMTDKYLNAGLRFQTETKQGTAHKNEQELINSLRYGLLSRDRIVTEEDVRSYIFHKLGNAVKNVDIRDGVAISPDIKKGIVRTTEIRISLKRSAGGHAPDFSITARFLEKELTKRAISKIPFKVSFV